LSLLETVTQEVAVDETRSYVSQPNQGEGNKTAAREYNRAQHDFVASGRVEENAQEAARAMNSPERVELERAEALGKGRAQPATGEMLAQRARQHAASAGEYLASNLQEYRLGALIIAGLVGYGLGYLIHGASTPEWRSRRDVEESSEPRTLFMRQTDWSKSGAV
jgi:hypothetical protein